MTVQILQKKFTVGQYHQMIESGILTNRDRDRPPGRGRVSLPRAMHPTDQPVYPTTQPMILNDYEISALGEETSPLTVGWQFPALGEETSPWLTDNSWLLNA